MRPVPMARPLCVQKPAIPLKSKDSAWPARFSDVGVRGRGQGGLNLKIRKIFTCLIGCILAINQPGKGCSLS